MPDTGTVSLGSYVDVHQVCVCVTRCKNCSVFSVYAAILLPFFIVYFFGFPASERFLRTVPSLFLSLGWVPPPGFGTTTSLFSGLLSAIF